ncbi:MAG TPA: hypothetical protein VFS76_11300 [Pyrinomonadaceae bacterium]|nr:hypothetical protein [Pyrinomonadaceae bacterium]
MVASLLLFVCQFANAQTTDPLERVLSELQAGRFENALAAADVIKKYAHQTRVSEFL